MKATKLFVLLIGVTSFARLFFGIDFTDEAYYLAMPHSFAMGNKPFVDEIFPQQFSSILITPLISIYKSFAPDYDGLFLSSRLCFYALSLFTFLAFYRMAKLRTTATVSMLVGSIFLVFHPFNLPVLSYNTLSYLFFSLGIVLSFSTTFLPLLLSGVTLVLSAFCNPYFTLPVSIHFLFKLWKQRLNFLSYFTSGDFIGACLMSALLFGVLLFVGIENIIATLMLVRGLEIWTSGFPKVFNLIGSIPNVAIVAWFVSLMGYVYFSLKSKKNSNFNVNIALLNSFVLLIFCIRYWRDTSILFFSHLGCVQLLGGLLLIFGLKKLQDPLFYIGRYLWVMGVLAGLVTAYSSANGLINSGMGFALATIGYILMLSSILNADKSVLGSKRYIFYRTPLISIFVILTALLHSQLSYTYRDEQPFYKLSTFVSEGPYAGLITSKEKYDYLKTIERSIRSIKTKNKTILFFDEFPVGYLMAPRQIPFTRAVWMFSIGQWAIPRTLYVEYYKNKKSVPEIVFDFKEIFVKRDESQIIEKKDDPLRSFLQKQSYKKVFTHKYLNIFTLE